MPPKKPPFKVTFHKVVEYREAKTEFERQYAQFVLDETGGVVFKAAELAGKERKDFYTLCHRAGVTPADHRHA